MGAKASTTAANGNQSPSRTGFNFLREIHGVEVANDNRQRARSLSSVPDIQNSHHSNHPNTYHPNTNAYNELMNMPSGNSSVVGGSSLHYEISSTSPDTDSNSHDDNNAAAMHQAVSNALGLGRVFTATSLPSHIWSLNGKCIIIICILSITLVPYIYIYTNIHISNIHIISLYCFTAACYREAVVEHSMCVYSIIFHNFSYEVSVIHFLNT